MLKKHQVTESSILSDSHEDEDGADDVPFSDIKQLIERANTPKLGFESAMLEYILCRFIQFGEDYDRNVLKIFQKFFRNFAVKDFFESENRIDITMTCFEYIHIEDDLFLPQFTAESFVKLAVSDYFSETKSKPSTITLQFLVN